MAERTAGLPADRRQSFRIGVHLGDVIVSDHRRVRRHRQRRGPPAGPGRAGAIVLSASVHEQVRDKLALPYRDPRRATLEEHRPPGARPSRSTAPRASGAAIAAGSPRRLPRPALVLIAAGGAFFWLDRAGAPSSATSTASTQSGLSVAVLLFTNQSGDANQDYFADGLTEDITRRSAAFASSPCWPMARVLPYRGKQLAPMDMGRALNARFLVGGSVRRPGDACG
jgi:adenylate cyclase